MVGARLAMALAAVAAAVGMVCTPPSLAAQVGLEPLFPELEFDKPLAFVPAPEGEAWYVVEQRGVVMRIALGNGAATVFVDIRDRVDDGPSEAGLLGMAFHPRFVENGTVYLSYTRDGSPLVSYLSAFTSRDGGRTLDPDSERIVLTLDQPYGNHNGGNVVFGPDGYLYIGFGDGGSGGDPHGNGQNTETLLGALLRIDVDAAAPYGIPPDNPFAERGGRPEIFAYGLRNPWRFSFDRESGALWLADVGQSGWEEIDLIERGGNYGWNIREGAHCYRSDECRTEGLIEPVAEYSHDEGCSVTGGYVYRGQAIPALKGAYLYADYCSGRLWGLFRDAASGGYAPRLLLETELRVSSFGEGLDGELYLVGHGDGGIYRIVGK
jgi:glucose/arabinose dehydrogenase